MSKYFQTEFLACLSQCLSKKLIVFKATGILNCHSYVDLLTGQSVKAKVSGRSAFP